MRRILLTAGLLLAFAGLGHAQAPTTPLLLQRPTLSKSHVAFTFAGDLWLVGRDGGEARRLTSGIGLEFGAYFSPDGSQLAFSAEYDGNIDAFVIPATGGEPKRITFHPGVDVVVGWTPDGKGILFSSGRTSYSRFNKLFKLNADGSCHPEELPLPMGEEGAISPDGNFIAYVPFWNRRAVPNAYIAWKRYRGGKASPIWIATLADSRIEKIPRTDSNDSCASWLDGKVYFISDRDGPTTLYSYDRNTDKVTREMENNGYDLIHACAGPDAIVYEQFGGLSIFDPKTKKSKQLNVKVTGDFPDVRARYEKVAKRIQSGSISPTGARAAFEARGEIITVPADKGDVRNLTLSTDACERDPAWSPDGKYVAYFSDASGEYELHLRDAKGTGEVKKLALGDAPNFYVGPNWSPDSKKISYGDYRNQLWFLDVESGKNVKVDSHSFAGGPNFDVTWSPDSRWIGYTRVLDNRLRAAYLYDTKEGKKTQITDGMSDVRHTNFDKSGKYLFATASTDVGPTTNGIDMSGMNRPVTRSVYLIVLNKDLPSPLAPESDEEKEVAAGDKTPAEKAKEEKEKAKDTATKIDLEGIGQRIIALPLPARDYVGLQVGRAGVIFLGERPATPPPPPQPGQPPMGGTTVIRFDLATRKVEPGLTNVRAFELSANGEKVLMLQGDKWSIVAAPAGASPAGPRPATASAGGSDGTLKLDDVEVYVDPRVEWKQMYREVWRLQRDFLYDPTFHGYDIKAAEKKYEVFLEGLRHRADLNYLFNDMLGNLVLGHTYVAGGDSPEAKRVRGGLLGADWKVENDRYRIARVYNGENWNPQLRAPLTQPGVNVKDGEYLLAVNGRNITAKDNLYKAFEATAGKSILLKVGPTPDGKDARDVSVVPVDAETGLRNLAWIEDNRRKVDKMTEGKVAYVYLPDTAFGGYNNFNRYFFAQVDKDGVVLDERFNGGGKAADYIIDYLRRPLLNYWTARDGKVYTTPGGAIFGPKAMIINEFAGSGGDAMPWYFRKTNCGPLIGKRTWGGLVGISGYPPLMDGGSVTAPSFAFFSPDGTWDVENKGVAPDHEVEHDPYLVRQGRDPQLEKAVDLVMEEIKKNPKKEVQKPAYPNYHNGNGKKTGG